MKTKTFALIAAAFATLAFSSASQAGETVLYVSDSISMDEFGVQMQKLFGADPKVSEFHFYSACGTKPGNWLASERGNNPYVTACGYWEKHSNGQPEIHYEWSHFGTKKHEVPYLENMITSINPSLVVVQLGLNMLDTEEPHTPLKPNWYINQFKAFKSAAFNTKPSSKRRCIWISPNKTTLWDSSIEETLVQLMKANLEPECTVIDSRKLTSSADVSPSDGYHLYGKASTRYGTAAYAEIQKILAK